VAGGSRWQERKKDTKKIIIVSDAVAILFHLHGLIAMKSSTKGDLVKPSVAATGDIGWEIKHQHV
jgi:hypothetical protein